jgi:hypothetical protein
VYEYNIISCAAREKTRGLLREADHERIAHQASASRRRRRLARLEALRRYLHPHRRRGIARQI